jgi:hypothetical protein
MDGAHVATACAPGTQAARVSHSVMRNAATMALGIIQSTGDDAHAAACTLMLASQVRRQLQVAQQQGK